jgi:hypothetical protein
VTTHIFLKNKNRTYGNKSREHRRSLRPLTIHEHRPTAKAVKPLSYPTKSQLNVGSLPPLQRLFCVQAVITHDRRPSSCRRSSPCPLHVRPMHTAPADCSAASARGLRAAHRAWRHARRQCTGAALAASLVSLAGCTSSPDAGEARSCMGGQVVAHALVFLPQKKTSHLSRFCRL